MTLPRTYYDADGITLFCGDMREIGPHLHADAVITDAPFAISDAPLMLDRSKPSNSRGGHKTVNGTYHAPSEWDREFDPAWCRVAAEMAPVVAWFGQWRKRGEVEAAMPHPLRDEIVWAKDCHVGPPCPTARRDERIWIFGRDGITPQRFETSVWDEPIIPTWAHRWHKNEKPLALMKRLISWLLPPTATLIDPFAGSGTTLRAALDLGMHAIGIEQSADHCAHAVERLSQRVLAFGAA